MTSPYDAAEQDRADEDRRRDVADAADEAFNDRRQLGCQCAACKTGVAHWSDCAVHNEPALPVGNCDCAGDDGYDLSD